MRRTLPPTLLHCAALLALLLSACQPAAPATPAPGLRIGVPKGAAADALEGAVRGYASPGGLAVQVEALGADQYYDQLWAELLSGSQRFDLVYLPADTLARWAAYRALAPLEGPVDEAGLAPWLDLMRFEDRLYGLPTEPGLDVLWARADWLSAAGIALPEPVEVGEGQTARAAPSWEWVRAAAEAIHQPPERYGLALAGSDLDAGREFSALLPGFGGQVFTADGQVQIDLPPARRALEFYSGLRGLAAPGAPDSTRDQVTQALREGRAGLGIAPLSAARGLLNCASSPKLCPAGGESPLTWLWLPGLAEQRAGLGDLNAWAIPLRARHPQEAGALAAWLTGPEGARAWAGQGGIPANRAVLADPPFADAGLRAGGIRLGWLETYRPGFPPVTTAEQVWKAEHAAAHSALTGDKSPAEALDEAAGSIHKALRQAGVRFE